MKKYNIIVLLLMALIGFSSCQDDEDNYLKLDENDLVKPTWEVQATNGIVVTDDNLAEIVGTWKWTKAEFGVQSPVTYVVVIDEDDTFSNAEEVARYTASDEDLKFTVEELNNSIQSFLPEGATKNDMKETTFYINVKAILGTTGNTAPLFAEPKTITFTPMPVIKVTDIFMIGEEFGGWNWDDKGVVQMIPVNGNPGVFWTVKYFTADKGFKWSNNVKAWGGDYAELSENEGFTAKDGNAYVAEDGLYMVYIDVNIGKIIITPAEVYGIGGCFKDDWGTGVAFESKGKLAEITTLSTGELRMYAKSPVDGIDWWRMEFIIINGKIEYRGNDGDQSRVSVDAGKVVSLDFNAGTGVVK